MSARGQNAATLPRRPPTPPALLQVVATAASVSLMERAGRRTLLLLSSAGMALAAGLRLPLGLVIDTAGPALSTEAEQGGLAARPPNAHFYPQALGRPGPPSP